MPLHTTENSFTVCCAPAMSRSTTYKTISHTVRAQGFNKCLSKHGRCVADARKKHMCSVSCYCISEWDEHFQNGRTVILLQPCFASARARCRPMPDPAPVIKAALPPTFIAVNRMNEICCHSAWSISHDAHTYSSRAWTPKFVLRKILLSNKH